MSKDREGGLRARGVTPTYEFMKEWGGGGGREGEMIVEFKLKEL